MRDHLTDQSSHSDGPNTEHREQDGASRRTLLRGAAGGGAVLLSGAGGAPWAHGGSRTQRSSRTMRSTQRVYVLVVDGCRPDEITPKHTPHLHALRSSGRWFPQARSMPIAETLPNHVMMMTGVRPNRSGVPANSIYDRLEGDIRTCGRASDITYPTVLERLRQRGYTSGTVLSKDYLYSVFGTRATYRWEPFPLNPITNHSADVSTSKALREMVTSADPHLVFASFGDVDRFGHSDLTGKSIQVLRQTALRSTDAQIGGFVAWLKTRRTWAHTTVIVLADHSMDWSYPDKLISLTKAFEGNALLDGKVVIANNGGAEVISYVGPSAQRDAALAEASRVALNTTGVLTTHSTNDLSLGTKAGDLVVFCRAGYRFTDPAAYSNPIPGNHGHPATYPIPFFIFGPPVAPAVVSDRAASLDVAPTITQLFSIPPPADGYDGTSRIAN